MSKQFEYENIGKQSTNMSEIMVYLAMFSTIIDKNKLGLSWANLRTRLVEAANKLSVVVFR